MPPETPANNVSTELPTGLVSLVFTDMVGSTHALQSLGDRYDKFLEDHHEIVREAIALHRGVEVGTDGDAFFMVFEDPHDAIRATVWAQRMLAEYRGPDDFPLQVRMGVHTGSVRLASTGYVGLDVHRAARISSAGHGGQVLVSGATRSLIDESRLPDGVRLRDLGDHSLKDLRTPEQIYDLVVDGLDSTFAPLRTLDNRPVHLPSTPTSFIGRESEVAELSAMLRSDDTRLVTLIGPGGTGKTRLSIEVARGMVDDFPRGIFFVPLAAVSESDRVTSAIAQVLGLREIPGLPLSESVHRYLGDQPILLVLDNFEQVVDGALVVSELLDRCPNTACLVSSRESLRVSAEKVYSVPPMVVPDGSQSTVDELMRIESSRLFLDRAKAASHTFELTEQVADDVHAICAHLEGIPLAIELAASNVNILPPNAIRSRLTSGLRVLKGRSRDVDPRHQTLRDTIAWSYDLLDDADRQLLLRSSVFRGGFSIEAAEAVCDPDFELYDDVLEGLQSLVSKSLLRSISAAGEPRFLMLETIRQFTSDELADDEQADAVGRRHLDFFHELIGTAAPDLVGPDQLEPVTRLITESDNVRAALGWALDHGEIDVATTIVTALQWFWIPQGQFSEGIDWAKRLLEMVPPDRPAVRAVVLDVLGYLTLMAGDPVHAQPLLNEAATLHGEHGAPEQVAVSRITEAVTLAYQGDMAAGPIMFEALERCQEIGFEMGIALAALGLGEGARIGGDDAAAEHMYNTCLALFRKYDNMFWLGYVLQNLAHVKLHQGDWEAAAELLAEAAEIGRRHDYLMVVNLYLAAMGGVAAVRGRGEDAARLFGAVDAYLNELGAAFLGADLAEWERNVAQAEELAGTDAFRAAWAEGAAWPREQAVQAAQALRS